MLFTVHHRRAATRSWHDDVFIPFIFSETLEIGFFVCVCVCRRCSTAVTVMTADSITIYSANAFYVLNFSWERFAVLSPQHLIQSNINCLGPSHPTLALLFSTFRWFRRRRRLFADVAFIQGETAVCMCAVKSVCRSESMQCFTQRGRRLCRVNQALKTTKHFLLCIVSFRRCDVWCTAHAAIMSVLITMAMQFELFAFLRSAVVFAK